jgi:hypothetical protein
MLRVCERLSGGDKHCRRIPARAPRTHSVAPVFHNEPKGETMIRTTRIIAALSLFAVAACAGKPDHTASADEVTQIMTMSALHVTIADNAPKPVKYGVEDGNVFNYY